MERSNLDLVRLLELGLEYKHPFAAQSFLVADRLVGLASHPALAEPVADPILHHLVAEFEPVEFERAES